MQPTPQKQLRVGNWIARVFSTSGGSPHRTKTFSLAHAHRDDGTAGVAAGFEASDLWEMLELVGLLAKTFREDHFLVEDLRDQIECLVQSLEHAGPAAGSSNTEG